MADYFTKFSVVLDLPSEAAQAYALDLAKKASRASESDKPPDNFPTELVDVIEDWQFETRAILPSGTWGIWFESETGGIDALCAFIQHLLQKFQPKGRVAFEWSNDCSKPRTDGYGGGAAIVTAKKIKSMNTYNWLRQHAPKEKGSK